MATLENEGLRSENDDIEMIRSFLTEFVGQVNAGEWRINAQIALSRLEAELAQAKQEAVRVIFKKKDLRVARDARVIALRAEVEQLRAECEIGARRNRTMEETIERLRAIADSYQKGNKALHAENERRGRDLAIVQARLRRIEEAVKRVLTPGSWYQVQDALSILRTALADQPIGKP